MATNQSTIATNVATIAAATSNTTTTAAPINKSDYLADALEITSNHILIKYSELFARFNREKATSQPLNIDVRKFADHIRDTDELPQINEYTIAADYVNPLISASREFAATF